MKNEPLFLQVLKLPLEGDELIVPMNEKCQSIPQSRTFDLQDDDGEGVSVFIYKKAEHLKEVTELIEDVPYHVQHDYIVIPIKSNQSEETHDIILDILTEYSIRSLVLYDKKEKQYLACLFYPYDYELEEIEQEIISAIQ